MRVAVTNEPERLAITAVPQPRRVPTFADDVRMGLSARPRRLFPKYFYDALGSALFEAITLLPEYYLTRAETSILREWGWEIVRALGNPIEFVELGSGSAIKTRILIEEALRVQGKLRYSPIDISEDALRGSAEALAGSYPGLSVHGFAGDYVTVLGTPHLARRERVLAMFMGSNVGNYEPADARSLLRRIASALKPGDGLLLGIDLKKDPEILRLAYDDPAGVTAAFNKNILARINRELGGTFDLNRFRHVAKYDRRESCVSSYLVATKAQSVRIEAAGVSLRLRAGERIHTESSYKFSPDDISALAASTGFLSERSWTDPQNSFSVSLFVRR